MYRMLSRISLIFGLLASIACAGPPAAPPPGDIAAKYAEMGSFDEAAREIDLAVRARPDDLTLRRQAARLHHRAGNTGKAIAHLEAALRVAPDDGTIWLELADREQDRMNVADAYVAYRRASALEPNDLRAVSGLASSASELGFTDEAQAASERLAQLERKRGSSR
jgi:tetratricopeptide (TPR) repeat protein